MKTLACLKTTISINGSEKDGAIAASSSGRLKIESYISKDNARIAQRAELHTSGIRSMRIFVQAPQRAPNQVPGGDALILIENTWNDFSYRTLYDAHLQVAGDIHELGFVKIMVRGQQPTVLPLKRGEQNADRLSDEFASLGTSSLYYERLAKLNAVYVAESLRDLALDPGHRVRFADDEVLRRSLNRDRWDPDTFYADARRIIDSGGPLPEDDDFQFTYTPKGGKPLTFSFANRVDGKNAGPKGPSRRTNILVGTNGVGKTHLLASIARTAYAPPRERDELEDDGRFDRPLGFPNIVAISYSPFDTFRPPELAGDNREQVALQIEEGTGRYAYCGMRDLPSAIRNPDRPIHLLTHHSLEIAFVQRIDRIKRMGRHDVLSRVLKPIFEDPSFARTTPNMAETDDPDDNQDIRRLDAFIGTDAALALRSLSSGHKIVIHMLTSLVAALGRNGLALIDEPETHLHPPLLAALMAGVKIALGRLKAYAIIATHSPVVAQETLASQVIHIRRVGGHIVGQRPDIQTFGENTGTLTRELFGLHTGASDFRATLSRMAVNAGSVEEVEDHLGETLSSTAIAYLTSIFEARDRAKD